MLLGLLLVHQFCWQVKEPLNELDVALNIRLLAPAGRFWG